MKQKQISIVLEIDEKEDDIELIKKIKTFISSFDYVKIVGTHIKEMKPYRN